MTFLVNIYYCQLQYGKAMTREVYHTCKICGKDLLQQSKNLKKHAKTHNISLENYFDVYIKGEKVTSVSLCFDNHFWAHELKVTVFESALNNCPLSLIDFTLLQSKWDEGWI